VRGGSAARTEVSEGPSPRRRGTILLGLLVLGCSEAEPRAPEEAAATPAIRVVDAAGATLEFDGPARRIVSLVPSVTRTLARLGALGAVVGRTDFDTDGWAAALPSVGGGLHPNAEALVALRPDLVIRFAGEQDPDTPVRLDALGIPHLAVRPERIADILTTITLVGAVTGRTEEAGELNAEIRAGLEAVRADAAGRPRLRAVYVLGGSPPWVAGPGTYIDELMDVVGADNVFSDLEFLYASVSPEEFLARKIDVILVPPGSRFDLRAPGARVVRVPEGMDAPGPDLAEVAGALARTLHGGESP